MPPHMDYYKADSEYGVKAKDIILAKYDNVYRYADESNSLLDGKAEAQYNTQEFYGAMTNVIQEVFSKKNVDLKAALDTAAKTVQETYYNAIKVE